MNLLLEERILAFLANPREEAFNSLALDIFEHQRQQNRSLAAYCDALGLTDQLETWRDIPGLPQNAFKLAEVRSFPAPRTRHEFRTSGTTGETYGRHLLPSLRLYEAAVQRGWDYSKLPRYEFILLMPSADSAPFSSLARMGSFLADSRASHFDGKGTVDVNRLRHSLLERQKPVILFGTALAFLNLLEIERGSRLPLPEGSIVMETGGFKGSGREIAKKDLYRQLAEFFGVPERAIWNEYGMTELSSQFYASGVGNSHFGPPWTRFLVIDPSTNKPAPQGEIGVLRLIDLANLWSVICLQTQDLAVTREDGGFLLLGRDPAAIPRGCSRPVDEILALTRS